MRYLLVFPALAILAGCSGRVRPEDLAYAREDLSQSLSAYQICAKEKRGDLKKCDALAKLIDADKKKLERLTATK
ncbi:MAG: hypothetical protein U1E25_10860 [Methylocystis sp.]